MYIWHFHQSQIYLHKGLKYGHIFISVLMNMKTIITIEIVLKHTLNFQIKKILIFYYFLQKKNKKEEAKKNIQIIERIIDLVKLISKRDLSSRGHKNESTLSLLDPIVGHSNFLDIILLLKTYDIVLNGHIDKIVKCAQVKSANLTCNQQLFKVEGR